MPKEYLNYIKLKKESVGDERRYEMLGDMLKNGSFLPRTVEYKDIDEAFRDWVRSLTIISDEGKEFPTISLFSNQRFSEYSQTWESVDENNNILLNFKSITRENNPQYGKIQSGLWNVPGERFYLMKKIKVLDDNGTESFLALKMKEPVAIDFNFKVCIFTTKYSAINEFNCLVNKLFAARQCYISPNGHFMPMILEGISDESKYDINNRQFYSQSFQIKVMGYTITEDDYRVEELPLKFGVKFSLPAIRKKGVDAELEEMEYIPITMKSECGSLNKVFLPHSKKSLIPIIDIEDLEYPEDVESRYFYKPLILSLNFQKCSENTEITMPIDFVVNKIENDNSIKNLSIKIDNEPLPSNPSEKNPLIIREGSKVSVSINRKNLKNGECFSIWKGYCPLIVLDSEIDEDFPDIYEEETEQ